MALIYLSSTLRDLKAHRQAVRDVLAKAEHLVRESYVADSARPTTKCLADVEECAIYVGIFAHRYGHVPQDDNPEQKSITELEYRYAANRKKVVLIFLLDPQAPWPSTQMDAMDMTLEPARRGSPISTLKNHLSTTHTPMLFVDAKDLANEVLLAVNKAVTKMAEAERLTQQKLALAPAMDPEATMPHARGLPNAMLLVHWDLPTDTASARLVKSVLEKNGSRVELLSWARNQTPGLGQLDKALLGCRTTGLFVSTASLPSWTALVALPSPCPELAFIRAQTPSSFLLLDGTNLALPTALAAFEKQYALGTWLSAGQETVGGELAAFLTAAQSDHPDFEHGRLIGLQYTVIAMTRKEARALAADPSGIADAYGKACHDHFVRATAQLAKGGDDWTLRYETERGAWRPFTDGRAIGHIVREVVDDINGRPVVPKRDRDKLKGHKIRLRYYPFDPLIGGGDDMRRVYQDVKSRGCLVVADELSLLHPGIREAAHRFLDDRQSCVVALSPNDPLLDPLDAAMRVQRQLGNLLNRFEDDLDPRCELAIAGRARLKRWLRFSVTEALGSSEAQGPDPDAKVRILAEIST